MRYQVETASSFDLVIIGSGPAGLSAALTAERKGFAYICLERGVLADTVYHYPVARPMFSTADELELEAGDLDPKWKPTREQLLEYYCRAAVSNRLRIETGIEVLAVRKESGRFIVETGNGTLAAGTVLVASGGFGKQRRLGVPGETPERVSYIFRDPFAYSLRDVLVAGGGNSAAEAVLSLIQAGARVTLLIRRDSLTGRSSSGAAAIKPWVLGPLEEARDRGLVRIILSSRVLEISEDSVRIETGKGLSSSIEEIRCNHIIALIGADPETGLLERAGVEIAGDGRPVYDPVTYETNIEGLYVAGHITREKHIRNAILTGRAAAESIFNRIRVLK